MRAPRIAGLSVTGRLLTKNSLDVVEAWPLAAIEFGHPLGPTKWRQIDRRRRLDAVPVGVKADFVPLEGSDHVGASAPLERAGFFADDLERRRDVLFAQPDRRSAGQRRRWPEECSPRCRTTGPRRSSSAHRLPTRDRPRADQQQQHPNDSTHVAGHGSSVGPPVGWNAGWDRPPARPSVGTAAGAGGSRRVKHSQIGPVFPSKSRAAPGRRPRIDLLASGCRCCGV